MGLLRSAGLLVACAVATVSEAYETYGMTATHRELSALLRLQPGAPPPLIVSIHRLGLANRLRHLAAAAVLAADLGFELRVRWKPAHGCNATLADLFDVERAGLTEYAGDGPALDKLLDLVDGETLAAVASPADTNASNVVVVRSSGVRLDLALAGGGVAAVVLDPRGSFAARDVTCHEFLHRKSAFYERLAAAAHAEVARARDRLRSAVRGRLAVGLHVRGFDARFDWPVVPPEAAGEEARTWDDGAPAHAHFRAARDVLDAHPRAVVFLASNDETVKRDAKALFAASELVYADWSGAPRGLPTHGARAALADWLALGDAALVLHSFGSSFGEEAAARRLAPSIRVRRERHVLGVDLNRAHCHHPLFENADAPPPLEGAACFGEGDRAVCAPPLRKAPCAAATDAWGVANVYC